MPIKCPATYSSMFNFQILLHSIKLGFSTNIHVQLLKVKNLSENKKQLTVPCDRFNFPNSTFCSVSHLAFEWEHHLQYLSKETDDAPSSPEQKWKKTMCPKWEETGSEIKGQCGAELVCHLESWFRSRMSSIQLFTPQWHTHFSCHLSIEFQF